jgi:hypothetical protein
MIASVLPSIFTMEIGGTPTLVFEAQTLREAHELCHEQFSSRHRRNPIGGPGRAKMTDGLWGRVLAILKHAKAPSCWAVAFSAELRLGSQGLLCRKGIPAPQGIR